MTTAQIQAIKQRYSIVGNCDGLNRAIEMAMKVAPIDFSVLVMGENGVGKEVFPRIIHDASQRRNKKYLAVNCGAIPEGTIDSELFGHVKGAFTGAVDSREGYFSAANGGTLFLDEVGELPLPTQARLLRVLETGEFIPVGSSEVKRTNVRIVAATNVNMDQAIAEGRFRQDLYYRLNSVAIQIPALRERGQDAVLLFKKFALEMSEQYKMPPIRLDAEATAVLLAYDWPGNVRQLKNIAENMSVTCEEREITADILRTYLPQRSTTTGQVVPLRPVARTAEVHAYEQERELIFQMLVDLRREVNELKRILGVGDTGAATGAPVPLPRHTDLGYVETPSAHPHSPAAPHAVKEDERAQYMDVEEVRDAEPAAEPSKMTGTLEDVEREMIRTTLEKNGGNRRITAARLRISERTLYRKIKEYGLD